MYPTPSASPAPSPRRSGDVWKRAPLQVANPGVSWSVGHGTTAGKVTVTEKANASGTGWVDQSDANKKKYDLTTLDGIKKSLGYKTAPEAAVDADPTRGLTLQIGDTSDGFNQIKV